MVVRHVSTLSLCFCLGIAAPSVAGQQLKLSAPLDFLALNGPHAVELGQISADDPLDAVVVAKRSAMYGCYGGNGDGTFGDAVATGPLYLEPTDVVVGDFDNDGVLDIAGVNNDTRCAIYYLSVAMGSSPGEFGVRRLTPVGPLPVQIEMGDFNHDNKLDLAVLSVGVAEAIVGEEYGHSLYVLEGWGTGAFKTPFVTALETTDAEAHFAVGDFDGDTWLDLALLEPSSGEMRLALNRGSVAPLSFRESAQPVSVGAGARRVASGDFTDDEASDLAVAFATPDGGAVEIFVSDGVESASPAGRAILRGPPTSIRVARIDADGALDVAIGGEGGTGSGRAYVVQGDGRGALGVARSTALNGVPSDVAVADLDGDGLGDLVLTLPDDNTFSSVLVTPLSEARGVFVRGDANGERRVDLSDTIALLGFLFMGGTTDCREALDTNNDLRVDVADPIYLLNYFFLGSAPPPSPFPEPGEDLREPTLGCERQNP